MNISQKSKGIRLLALLWIKQHVSFGILSVDEALNVVMIFKTFIWRLNYHDQVFILGRLFCEFPQNQKHMTWHDIACAFSKCTQYKVV